MSNSLTNTGIVEFIPAIGEMTNNEFLGILGRTWENFVRAQSIAYRQKILRAFLAQPDKTDALAFFVRKHTDQVRELVLECTKKAQAKAAFVFVGSEDQTLAYEAHGLDSTGLIAQVTPHKELPIRYFSRAQLEPVRAHELLHTLHKEAS